MEEVIRQLSSLNENVTSIGEDVANISRRVDDIDRRVVVIESQNGEENVGSHINQGFVSLERGIDNNGRHLPPLNPAVVFTPAPDTSANAGDVYELREVGGQVVQEGKGP